MLLDPLGNISDDFRVCLNEIVSAHAWLARQSRGDHTHIRARDISDVIGARDLEVETKNRGEVREIESFTLGHPLDDVVQHHVSKLASTTQHSERATDLPCADERNLLPACHVACHLSCLLSNTWGI